MADADSPVSMECLTEQWFRRELLVYYDEFHSFKNQNRHHRNHWQLKSRIFCSWRCSDDDFEFHHSNKHKISKTRTRRECSQWAFWWRPGPMISTRPIATHGFYRRWRFTIKTLILIPSRPYLNHITEGL